MNAHTEYLGDAVYASFDGYHICLHLNSQDSKPLIMLKPRVMRALIGYQAFLEQEVMKEDKS